MAEYIPFSLYCGVGKVEATVFVRADGDMQDNVDSFVEEPCAGCEFWNRDNILRTEAEIRRETLAQFGSDDESMTGIRVGGRNQLEQLLVNDARIHRDGKDKLIVGLCSIIRMRCIERN